MPLNLHAAALILALALTATLDYKHRAIHNRVWVALAAILLPLQAYHLYSNPGQLSPHTLWAIGLSLASLALWLTNSWGGADAKGTILFSWTAPLLWTGHAWLHILALTIPASLLSVLTWNRLRGEPCPYFLVFAPWTAAILML